MTADNRNDEGYSFRQTSGSRRRSRKGTERLLERVGSLTVEEHLGSTETCEVYRCLDPNSGDEVVAKVLFRSNDVAAQLAFNIECSDVVALARTSELKPPEQGSTPFGPYYAIEARDGRLVAFVMVGC